MEKSELEAALKASKGSFTGKKSPDASQVQNRDSSSVSDVSPNFTVIFTFSLSVMLHASNSCRYSLLWGLVNWLLVVTVVRSFQKFPRKRRHGNILTEDE
jgi:hypothetical protein